MDTIDVSVHALERTEVRTRLRHDDVRALIEAGAVITLGATRERRYLLFWSPFDRRTKIAVMSPNGTVVISILENNFCLPDGVEAVTPAKAHAAERMVRQFLFARLMKAVTPRNEIVSVRVQVIRIGFRSAKRHVFTGMLGIAHREEVRSVPAIVTKFREQIRELLMLLEDPAVNRANDPLRYRFRVVDARGRESEYTEIRHSVLRLSVK